MTPIRKWLRSLSWPLLLLVCLALLGFIWGLGVAAWHLAHDMDWWTFGLFFLAMFMANPVINSTREVLRERKKS